MIAQKSGLITQEEVEGARVKHGLYLLTEHIPFMPMIAWQALLTEQLMVIYTIGMLLKVLQPQEARPIRTSAQQAGMFQRIRIGIN